MEHPGRPMTGTESKGKGNIGAVYIAKGIGIVLVVCGHVIPDESRGFLGILHHIIFQFPMSLFFMLAGYLYKGTSMAGYGAQVGKKLKRLGIPYLSIAAIFFLIKFVPGLFLDLDHPVSLGTVVNVLIDPVHSYLPLLWFLYTIMLIFAIFPLLEALLKRRELIFAVALLAIFFRTTEMFCVDQVLHNTVYFAFGFMLAGSVDFRKRYPAAPIALLAAACVAGFTLMNTVFAGFFLRARALFAIHALAVALLGGSACVCFALLLERARESAIGRGFDRLGFYSMSIYLFHPLFSSSVRVVLDRALPAGMVPSGAAIALAIGAGIIGPLLLEKHVLRRISLARRLLLGLS